uniref:Ig-like domain-containing protein n=1 Tax=Leptobrachium leishanense TaxID=445787 RepID=A0A8C5PVY4_9ANUR
MNVQVLRVMFFLVIPALWSYLPSISAFWPEKYVPVLDSDSLTLHCDSYTSNVQWMVPSNECLSQSLHSSTLLLSDISYHCTGLYTCLTMDEVQVTSTHVLIRDSDNEHLNISCFMDSYSSPVLQCSAYIPISGDRLVRAKANISSAANTTWLEMKFTDNNKESLVRFNLSVPKWCPYEEQENPIVVTVEAMTDSQYMHGQRAYYIRDIVVPGAPEHVIVNKTSGSWKYPSTWAKPSSFFPLLFQVHLQYKDHSEGLVLQNRMMMSFTNVKCMRVRCRDMYYNSSWSVWASPVIRSRCSFKNDITK